MHSNGQLTAKNERWLFDLDMIAGVRQLDESVIEDLDTLCQCSRHEEVQEPKGSDGKGPAAERVHLFSTTTRVGDMVRVRVKVRITVKLRGRIRVRVRVG